MVDLGITESEEDAEGQGEESGGEDYHTEGSADDDESTLEMEEVCLFAQSLLVSCSRATEFTHSQPLHTRFDSQGACSLL